VDMSGNVSGLLAGRPCRTVAKNGAVCRTCVKVRGPVQIVMLRIELAGNS